MLWAVTSAAAPDSGEWISLFDGRTLDGWTGHRGEPVNWEAVDGELRCKGGTDGVRVLLTELEFGNFLLVLEFNYAAGCNSGVFFRMPNLETGRPAFDGNEIQIVDEQSPRYAEKMTDDRRTGAHYEVAPPLVPADKGPGQWQTLKLRCAGSRLTVKLNGKLVQDVDLATYPESLKAEHPGLSREAGHIGLQSKDTAIRFRNIRVRRLAVDVEAP